jgi:hypothetical protein
VFEAAGGAGAAQALEGIRAALLVSAGAAAAGVLGIVSARRRADVAVAAANA